MLTITSPISEKADSDRCPKSLNEDTQDDELPETSLDDRQ